MDRPIARLSAIQFLNTCFFSSSQNRRARAATRSPARFITPLIGFFEFNSVQVSMPVYVTISAV